MTGKTSSTITVEKRLLRHFSKGQRVRIVEIARDAIEKAHWPIDTEFTITNSDGGYYVIKDVTGCTKTVICDNAHRDFYFCVSVPVLPETPKEVSKDASLLEQLNSLPRFDLSYGSVTSMVEHEDGEYIKLVDLSKLFAVDLEYEYFGKFRGNV